MKRNKNHKLFLCICSIALFIVVIIIFILYNSYNINELYETCNNVKNNFITNRNTSGKVSELIDFDFDFVYSFEPYKSVQDMSNEIGFYSKHLKKMRSDGTFNIVFIKDKKIICMLYGNGEDGYYIDLKYGKYSKNDILNKNYIVEENSYQFK